MAKPNDRKAKAFVRHFLATTCGVTLVDAEQRHGKKNVDFEMKDGPQRVLVAELKTIEYTRPSEATGWTMIQDDEHGTEAERVGGYNGPARIAKKIADAHRQVSTYSHPWAVILHNEDIRTDISDFFEVFAGERVIGRIGDRRIIVTNSRKIALGKTLKIRYEVDLFVWVDRLDRPCRLGVWWSTPVGEKIARKYFSAADSGVKFPARWPRLRTPSP